jgi:uncharacterized membrane protein YjfL (UPF0719 family)
LDTIATHLDPGAIAATIVYSLIGMALFALAFWLFDKMAPFSIRKEIEDDQNTALGVILGSAMLGIAIIVAAAIQG